MTVLVIAGMTLVVLAALGYPLVRRRCDGTQDEGWEKEQLAERKDSLYGGIQDLELDRRTGKVSAEDYEEMRTDFEIEAARVLERMEADKNNNDRGTNLCPKCQAHAPPGASFCPGCGQRLTPACPACGVEVGAEDRFCGDCGAKLTPVARDKRMEDNVS